MLDILKIIYQFENHAATTFEIRAVRKKLGFSDEKSYNSLIVQNGKRVKSYFNKEAILDSNGEETFWNWFFDGEYVNGKNKIYTDVIVGKSGQSKGWALSRKDMSNLIPIEDYEGNYPISVDGVECEGKLNITPRLFYSSNELQEHLTKLAEEDPKQRVPLELEFKDENRKGFEFKLKKELVEAIKSKYVDLDIKYPHNSYDLIDKLLENEKPSVSLDDYYEDENNDSSFYEYLLERDYYFDKETIENYLLSLKVKPFAILTGNSGTGKTKLSQLFAQYLSETNSDLTFDEEYQNLNTLDNEDYFSFKTNPKRKYLLEGKFSVPPKDYLNPIIDFNKLSNDVVTFEVDGFKSEGHLIIKMSLDCTDKNLSDYFKESVNKDSFSIKINKNDIKKSLIDIDELTMENSEFMSKIGTYHSWTLPSECWENNFIPIKRSGDWNVIIDGKLTTATYKIHKIEFYFIREPEGLQDYLNKISSENPGQKLNIKLNISREELDKVINHDYFREIKDSVEFKGDYLEVEMPIGSQQVKNSVFKEVLPLDVYSGECDYLIDGVPAKGNIHIYVKLKLKEKTATGNIKIKYSDIEDLITDEGYLVDTFDTKVKVGSAYYRRTWDLSKDNNIEELIPIKTYSKECEIIVDGVPQNSNISIYPVVRFDEDEELSNHLKKLYDEDSSQLIDLKIDLSNYRNDKYIISSIESNYKIVPVGANWTENRNIVGYYNLITEKYQSTPAYELIKQSNRNLDSPHFLILDEMNLSHVERYFADFLSAIESGENIPLYGIEDDLEIPNNLFIIGTVNVDETTYMFSPKVLDRANVLEFETYSSKDYMMGNINLDAPNGNIGYLENPLVDSDIRNLGINELKEAFDGVKVQNSDFWDLLSDEIFKFQNILKKSGFDFGFRVINEIVRFMLVAWRYEGSPSEWTNWERYFDAQIKQKLLPKLHGSEKILGDTLKDLAEVCVDGERVKYYSSAKKLKEMMDVLDKQRYVSFIN